MRTNTQTGQSELTCNFMYLPTLHRPRFRNAVHENVLNILLYSSYSLFWRFQLEMS